MVPDLDASVQVGEVLAGKYRVERVLGVGGMGVVVAATHLQLGQMVALKFIRQQAITNPAILGRFEREARAAACIRSEHVARTIDIGQLETGSPYIVMEYLEGDNLASLLRQRGAMPVALACDYLIQACEALAEAHSLGIVHRDLKPGNLFLANLPHGRKAIKVLDFGVSKSLSSASDPGMTRTQDIMGSPGYMSPEQMRSAKNVDGRSDLWSLGVILYELVIGERPFVADTLTALCFKIATEPPAPLPPIPALDPGFAAVVHRALEKEPILRHQSAAELARALAPWASPESRALAFRLLNVATEVSPASDPYAGPTLGVVTTLNAAAGESRFKTPRSRKLVFGGVALAAIALGIGIAVARCPAGGDANPTVRPAQPAPAPNPEPAAVRPPPAPAPDVAEPTQQPSQAAPTRPPDPAPGAPRSSKPASDTHPQESSSTTPDPARIDGNNAAGGKKPSEPAPKSGKRTKPKDQGKPKDSFDPFGSPD